MEGRGGKSGWGGGPGRASRKEWLVRVLAILAAVAFVGAFALATMLPPSTSLAATLGMIDGHGFASLAGTLRASLGKWAWAWLVAPVMMRPVWLLPAAAGVVLGGLAITLRGPGAPKSPKWKL